MSDDRNITGGAELDAFLKTLAPKIEKNIMRSALRAGAKVFKAEAQANVPVRLGTLRKSVRVSGGSKKGEVFASVKAGNKKAWYWHFIEFGTGAHRIGPKVAKALLVGGAVVEKINHPGAQAKPFLRPALDVKADEAIAAITAQIRKRLTLEGINTPAPEET
jgi:HK97 gp10 family phage protein